MEKNRRRELDQIGNINGSLGQLVVNQLTYWNYPQNSNDLQLYLGFVEVLQVHDDLVARDSHCQDCAARGEFVQQTQVVLAGGS